MGTFGALCYNNQKWAVLGEDGAVLFTGKYTSCRQKAFELFQTGTTIKNISMYDRYGDIWDYVSMDTAKAELEEIEAVKKTQREQVLEEIELDPVSERHYNHIVKAVNDGTNESFNEWHELTDIEPETFLKHAKWLFADPCPNGYCTRALGINLNGMIQRLKIVRWEGGTYYYEDKHLGRLWSSRPCITQLTIR